MDTRLINNDNEIVGEKREVAEEKKWRSGKGHKERKTRRGLGLVCIMTAVVMVSVSLASFKFITQNVRSAEEAIRDNGMIREEYIRFAKNINRFYCYYGGFDYVNLSDAEKAERFAGGYQETLLNKQNELQYQMFVEQQDILKKYGELQGNRVYLKAADDGLFVSDSGEALLEGSELYAKKELELSLLKQKYDNLLSQLSNDAEKDAVAAADKNYYEIKNYLENGDGYRYFVYYFVDEKEKAAYTNIKKSFELIKEPADDKIGSFLAEQTLHYITLDNEMIRDVVFNNNTLGKSFEQNGMKGYLIVPSFTEYQYARDIYYNSLQYESSQAFYKIVVLLSLAVLATAVVLGVRNRQSCIAANLLVYKYYRRIPFTIKGIMGIFSVGWLLLFMQRAYYSDYNLLNSTFWMFVLGGSCTLIGVALTVEYIVHVFRKRAILKDEAEYRLIRYVFRDITYLNRSGNSVMILMFYGVMAALPVVNLFIYMGFFRFQSLVYIALLAMDIVSVYYLRMLLNYAKTSYFLKEMYNGNVDILMEESGTNKKTAFYFNNIKHGFMESIQKMLKSERMKTELITNVSHDLKTPLTSIINYVEILKNEGLNSNRATEYLNVIEQKSQRLNVLIEDLFEASKLSSGNIELDFQAINVVDLMRQTLGELNEKIVDSKIDFRFHSSSEIVNVRIDGKKMWRVFDNLINNMIKYAQENTRAYLDIEEKGKSVCITFRNISNHEINFHSEELFERFKRGDVARATEGSGLGLSIARSIVSLHGGTMDIVLDGDLFKVIIELNQPIIF